jgi:hypothetical protein
MTGAAPATVEAEILAEPCVSVLTPSLNPGGWLLYAVGSVGRKSWPGSSTSLAFPLVGLRGLEPYPQTEPAFCGRVDPALQLALRQIAVSGSLMPRGPSE